MSGIKGANAGNKHYRFKHGDIETDDKCKECKKDWTKCSCCPVMMKWLKEQKTRIRNDQ